MVEQAVAGDQKALEAIVVEIQEGIFNLAVKILWHPEDAKDATQEILIRIVTRLNLFKGESSFRTWAYRVASNHLLNYKKKRFKAQLNFEAHSAQLAIGLSDRDDFASTVAEKNFLIQEAKVGCSQAMLQCLKVESRMIYVLSEILDFNGKEGASILGISHDSYRQKLARTRKKLYSYLRGNCGIVNPANPCRCSRKVQFSIDQKLIDPQSLLFAEGEASAKLLTGIENLIEEGDFFSLDPRKTAPDSILERIREAVMI